MEPSCAPFPYDLLEKGSTRQRPFDYCEYATGSVREAEPVEANNVDQHLKWIEITEEGEFWDIESVGELEVD